MGVELLLLLPSMAEGGVEGISVAVEMVVTEGQRGKGRHWEKSQTMGPGPHGLLHGLKVVRGLGEERVASKEDGDEEDDDDD